MTQVAAAMGVSASNLLHRIREQPQGRGAYDKQGDDELAQRIEAVLKKRPSYGYRRVAAILNHQPNNDPVNHKRVYRVMSRRRLLLQRNHARPTRTHSGKIITLKSDLRWCSDGFEFRCWNGEKVFVIFSLDCCDRESIAFVAKTEHIDGRDVQDLMALTVEARFGTTSTPHKVQWLSDNGPPYTAHETRSFGQRCGLEVCNTPAYSPESNGIAEAFVKTFKRDYVYLADIPDAETPSS